MFQVDARRCGKELGRDTHIFQCPWSLSLAFCRSSPVRQRVNRSCKENNSKQKSKQMSQIYGAVPEQNQTPHYSESSTPSSNSMQGAMSQRAGKGHSHIPMLAVFAIGVLRFRVAVIDRESIVLIRRIIPNSSQNKCHKSTGAVPEQIQTLHYSGSSTPSSRSMQGAVWQRAGIATSSDARDLCRRYAVASSA